MSAHCLVLSCLYIVTRTRTVAQVLSLSSHPHVHVHVSVSPRLALPLYFPHFLPHSFHFLPHLKFVDYNLLFTPHKEGMDLSDEFLLTTGYEPNAYDFKETSVEPYTELLDSPPLFSSRVSSADIEYDDAALEDMLHQAHRAHAYHSLREDLSVSLSTSSMSDRTGRQVGDRTGRPVEQRNQEVFSVHGKTAMFAVVFLPPKRRERQSNSSLSLASSTEIGVMEDLIPKRNAIHPKIRWNKVSRN